MPLIFFVIENGYLQHSKDKHEFKTFCLRILDARYLAFGQNLSAILKKIARIRRPRINPADSIKLLASVWSHLFNFMAITVQGQHCDAIFEM